MQRFPESDLVRRTFTLREMDFPPEVKLTKRSLLRWFALSTGLISPQESRATFLEVLDCLLYFQVKKKQNPTTLEIQDYLKKKNGKEVSEKLIRYHLKRLLDLNFLRRKQNKYFFNNSPKAEKDDLKEAYNYWISKTISKTLENNETVLEQLIKSYK